MKLRIFTVYDQVAKAHLPPFFLPQEGQAIRTFTDMVNNPEHQFGQHPEDYTLTELGVFDDETAEISLLAVPNVLGTGIKFKDKPALSSVKG